MNNKLLTKHNLEFLSLEGGCTGSSGSTLARMPHCLKSHVTAHINVVFLFVLQEIPATMTTASNQAFVKFVSDGVGNSIGFRLTYTS